MFFGKSNFGGNNINVNTNGLFQSYSDTALVTVGAWNQQLSVKIRPAIGKDENGLTQYAQNKEQIINTSITQENAIVLVKAYEKEVAPAIENGTSAKVSISMGSEDNKKVLSIGYDGTDAYLEVAVAVAPNGIANENNIIKHKFNKKSGMKNYDPETGAGEEIVIEADLINFVEKLRKAQDLVATVAHSIKYNNAVGAAYSGKGGNQQQPQQNGFNAPENQFNGSDMGDFLPFN